MGMHVAGRTKRLRIGTAVTLAGFYHPLRLAEELALLDNLSGGRLDWGAGRGYDPTEFRAFGVRVEDSAARMRECVDIVLEAFRDGRVNHHGKHWQFDNIEVLPKPVQKPHPPVWLAASSPESVQRAAEAGFSILMDPHSSHDEIGAKKELYWKTLAAHGHSPAGREFPTARMIAIAPTNAEAEAVARAGAEWTIASYARAPATPADASAAVERYVKDVAIHGSPERVIDQIQSLRERIGLDYLMCAPLSHESFMLFTDKVLPKLL
jgi:alkanesulfonate monooxygenase SsuD/methylene tetrahydromethanopterin reductase-like flavin-dependent oxidoreductase (luciferase family)